MAIQDDNCANCGKPLSPYWRDKCHHCDAPMSVARPNVASQMYAVPPPPAFPGAAPAYGTSAPAYAPPPPASAQRPARVQSVLRGPTEASCLQQAIADGQQAAANGYTPVWQGWGREGATVTLTILYDLIAPAPAPAATAPAAWSSSSAPPAPEAPAAPPLAASAPLPPPPLTPPMASTAVYTPPPPAASYPPEQSIPAPAAPTSGGSPFVGRVIRAVGVFVVAFIVWYIYYSLERQL